MSSAPHLLDSPAAQVERATPGGLRFSVNWITRPLFGVLLAAVAVGATVWGGIAFVAFLLLGTAAAAREWHRLFTRGDFLLPTAFTVAAMAAALLWQLYFGARFGAAGQAMPFAILLLGSVANLLLGIRRHEAPLAHAAGTLYIGAPTVALLLLRQSADHPVWTVVLLLLAVWATDTGALISGSLIGGPKLAPMLSPKKTWAGFFGGTSAAAVVAGVFAVILRAAPGPAALFAVALSLAGHAGDLFESYVKRRVGRKDSGGLIPGHGGVLDRIDSILFAAPVAAVLILLAGFDPLAGLLR
jgi:phosphatidate cytidylyltransferase